MMVDFLAQVLVRFHLAVSVAVLIVLVTRPLARRWLGPELAYALWMVVPVMAMTGLFPSLRDWSRVIPTLLAPAKVVALPAWVLAAYLAGACSLLGLFILSELRFRRMARDGEVGPAVLGLWPRMVVPSDYRTRFDEAERRLIREHERTHIDCGHPGDNRLIALFQILCWFNPLAHLAASCARLDQELACDARVIARLPAARRAYGETLLKAQGPSPWSVLACALADGGRHPLEIRIRQLGRAPISIRRHLKGAAVLGGFAIAAAVTLWALIPASYAALGG